MNKQVHYQRLRIELRGKQKQTHLNLFENISIVGSFSLSLHRDVAIRGMIKKLNIYTAEIIFLTDLTAKYEFIDEHDWRISTIFFLMCNLLKCEMLKQNFLTF